MLLPRLPLDHLDIIIATAISYIPQKNNVDVKTRLRLTLTLTLVVIT